MTSSLVGSEMCIRDRALAGALLAGTGTGARSGNSDNDIPRASDSATAAPCLLYTSDAADDM
eukprot:2555639-Prorocentrum_lima.AAC.1